MTVAGCLRGYPRWLWNVSSSGNMCEDPRKTLDSEGPCWIYREVFGSFTVCHLCSSCVPGSSQQFLPITCKNHLTWGRETVCIVKFCVTIEGSCSCAMLRICLNSHPDQTWHHQPIVDPLQPWQPPVARKHVRHGSEDGSKLLLWNQIINTGYFGVKRRLPGWINHHKAS